MIALLQRVTQASVTVDGETVGAIAPGAPGVLVFLGVMATDGDAQVTRLAERVAGYRILNDAQGRPGRSVLDVPGASFLVVSQFTLGADTRKGRRPDYGAVAKGEQAESLYESFVAALRAHGAPVETGRFGAMMQVALVNDGPVTFRLEVE